MRSIIFTATLFFLVIYNYKAQVNSTNNRISMDISTNAQNSNIFNYDSCFAVGDNLGMSSVGLFQSWSAVETSPLNYNMMIFNIANLYYPAVNMPVDLTIAPINTNVKEVPSDLTSTAFSSTVMISRFNRLLDSIKVHIPNVTLSSLVIGSEHDVFMGSNTTLWADYTTFYNAVMIHAKTLWPGLKVATELTFDGIINHNTLAQTLNTNSDYIGVSYYPLNSNFTVKPISTIPVDFATLVNLYSSKPINFYQYGYPSSATCNSSDALQSQFITQTFLSWDVYASNIRMIDFTWIHDLSAAAVNSLSVYYGITNTAFLEYLRTIGLRTWNNNGTDKPALNELRCQAKQRGFNNLPLNCPITSLNKNKNNALISIYPNPATDILNIDIEGGKFDGIIICDVLGNRVGQYSFSEQINISHLNNGVYSLKVFKNQNEIFNAKFIISK
ncbi:MAG: T9SS type A sorting domain-containing protein [Bacteroidetes bacterium]|nr:T9SS type A sorting domain-containing protein [Bacteroidota bacterium]